MDVVILDTIGGVVVKKIGEGAFCENYKENWRLFNCRFSITV